MLKTTDFALPCVSESSSITETDNMSLGLMTPCSSEHYRDIQKSINRRWINSDVGQRVVGNHMQDK